MKQRLLFFILPIIFIISNNVSADNSKILEICRSNESPAVYICTGYLLGWSDSLQILKPGMICVPPTKTRDQIAIDAIMWLTSNKPSPQPLLIADATLALAATNPCKKNK
jgi:hypothetical protein